MSDARYGRDAAIYKVLAEAEWTPARAAGAYGGGADDRRDGFIHFSTAAQLPETLRRHFSAQPGLVLLAVDAAMLGLALRWEPSRGGDLFPHLYGDLPAAAVTQCWPLMLADDGVHVLPSDLT